MHKIFGALALIAVLVVAVLVATAESCSTVSEHETFSTGPVIAAGYSVTDC